MSKVYTDNIEKRTGGTEMAIPATGKWPEGNIADDAVTLAKMAGLARGKLIVGDSSGDPSALTVGTADQVLLSDGTDATWSDLSTGTSWQAIKTAAFTAVAGEGYPVNTTSAAITATLPATASVGDTIEFVDYAGTFGTNNLTLDPQSLNLKGQTADVLVIVERQAVTLTYVDATQGWVPTSGVNESGPAVKSPYDIEYLVIGGGGGGGGLHRAGGGGAGGYRNSFASETSGRNSATETPWNVTLSLAITVTVGAAGTMNNGANGGTGGSSSIAMTGQTTVTSYGGGGGGKYQTNATAGTYGSGAGAGHQDGVAHTGSTGSSAQGFDGGDTSNSSNSQGACGGGASADGDDGGKNTPTTGGNGYPSLITGASVTRGGGGGGGYYGSGAAGTSTGGTGGGGNGGSASASDPNSGVSDGAGYYYPTSGTVNTGGGGGGVAGTNGNPAYGAGGSGVVILRMATSIYSGTTTGSPTVGTDGLYTVLTFNASGSYTT